MRLFPNRLIVNTYRRFPRLFGLGKLTHCFEVYIPVAVTEVELTESVAEEFDSIEWIILRLYSQNIKSPSKIAEMLGISEAFVQKTIKILEGYEHIRDGEITETGIASANEEKKYLTHRTRQLVQIDPNLYFIYDKSCKHEHLIEKEKMDRFTPVIEPNQVVNAIILDQLKKDFHKYKQINSSVLHINSVKIEDIISKKVKYSKGYILKFENVGIPLVFHVVTHKKDRFLRPITLSPDLNELLDTKLDEVYLREMSQLQYLMKIFDQIVAECKNKPSFPYLDEESNKPHQTVLKMLNDYWKLPYEVIKYDYNGNTLLITYPVEAINVNYMNWVQLLLHVLEGGAAIPYVEFGVTMELSGTVCYITTDHPTLIECAKIIQKNNNYFELKALYESIEDTILAMDNRDEMLDYVLEQLKNRFIK